jgi:hypothetical protein
MAGGLFLGEIYLFDIIEDDKAPQGRSKTPHHLVCRRIMPYIADIVRSRRQSSDEAVARKGRSK